MSLPSSTSPWVYFLSGSLLPTIAFIIWRKNILSSIENDYYDDSDDDDSDDDDDDNTVPLTNKSAKDWGMKDAPYKMVLCVNQGLGMGKGKIAAQCCHAAVACVQKSRKLCPNGVAAWERTGCAKIAVKCPSEEEMRIIYDKAIEKELPVYLVEDAGRTQIAAGSRTVLGIGPCPTKVFDDVTSHLKLL
jgi:PTH2 family peptidyl-tRNA hydrolase